MARHRPRRSRSCRWTLQRHLPWLAVRPYTGTAGSGACRGGRWILNPGHHLASALHRRDLQRLGRRLLQQAPHQYRPPESTRRPARSHGTQSHPRTRSLSPTQPVIRGSAPSGGYRPHTPRGSRPVATGDSHLSGFSSAPFADGGEALKAGSRQHLDDRVDRLPRTYYMLERFCGRSACRHVTGKQDKRRVGDLS